MSALVAASGGCAERAEGARDDIRAARAATTTLPELWEAAGDMSVPRQYHAAATLDATHVLVCGGRKNLEDTATFYDSCEIFDAATKQFQAAAALPDPCVFASLVAIEPGEVLAFGGSYGVSSTYLANVSSFQWSGGTGAWSALTAFPGARDHHVAAWLPASRALAVVGGFNGTVTLDDATAQLQDNGSLSAWLTATPASARFDHTATVLSDGASLLVAGGRAPSSGMKTSVRRLTVSAGGAGAWTELAPLPSPLAGQIGALEPSGGRVLLAGGRHASTSVTADAGYYDPAGSGSYSAVAPMSTPRLGHAAAWLQGKLIVTGGVNASLDLTDSVEFYDPARNQWFPLDAMSLPRRDHTLTVLDDRSLLIAGGTAVALGAQATASAEVLTPRLLGEPCDTMRHECLTGYCTDGVCCNEACDGSCQRCEASGTCRNVSGEPVGDRSCEGGLVCKAGACLTSCSKHEDCMSDRFCEDGQCVPRKAQGSECAVERECADGAPCVDGFCCDSACDGICESCGEPEWNGTCVAVSGAPVGDRDGCGEPSGECGLLCNGVDRTACHYQKAKTTCGQPGCTDGVEQGSSTCDGHGNCKDNSSDCGAFACTAEGRCGTECTNNDDCRDNRYMCLTNASPATCVPKADLGKDCASDANCNEGLVCQDEVCCEQHCPDGYSCAFEKHRGDCRKALGAACTADQECGSEHCVDGVCCDAACEGQCEYCASEESPGECRPVRGEAPPRREPCKAGTDFCAASSCDGVDSAASRANCLGYANVDAVCEPATCADDNTFHAERYCAADGTCRAATSSDCGAYVCAEAGCLTSCSNNDECSEGNQCLNGSCGPPAAHCEGDSLVLASGAKQDCEGFRCVANACLETCTTSAQCVAGFVCDDRSRACVSAIASTSDSGCGCSVPGEPARRADSRWMLGLLLGLAWRRRRRARSLSAVALEPPR